MFAEFPFDAIVTFIKSNVFIFTIVSALGALATWLINREVGRRTMAKLALEQQAASDHHILSLCQALSDTKQSLQLAAAALLVDRARTTDMRGRAGSERNAILQALLAATIDDKRTGAQMPASADLCKFVADSIVEVLHANRPHDDGNSPLKAFYWQQARLTNADWRDVDARGLDLFATNLDRALLRRANFQNTVLYNASLRSAVLCGADLRGADLRNADLSGADLRPCDRTATIVFTKMSGALLQGADLSNAKLAGVDLTGVKVDQDTKWPTGFYPPGADGVSTLQPAGSG